MTFEPNPPPRLTQVKTTRPSIGWRQDGGAAIVLLSAVMLFLLGMAAFAVDLGWLWLNASRIQSAADAAALSGVTHLPADTAQAQSSAEDAARVNGWPVGGTTTLVSSVGDDNTLDVTLTAQVDTYFLRVFGQPQVTIRRDATAQYILPVPLGSPFNNFGDNTQNFWASIGGEFLSRQNGDPFSTRCEASDEHPDTHPIPQLADPRDIDPDGAPDTDTYCDWGPNPWYRSSPFGGGYFIGVEVAPGTTSLDLQVYDIGYFERNNSNHGTGERPVVGGATGPDTYYTFYDADGTPYDLTDMQIPTTHAPCGRFVAAIDKDPSTGSHTAPPPTWVDNWTSLCTIANPTPGLHILQIRTEGGGSNNNYGLRALTNGSPAKVYGIDSIGVFTNVSGVADLYLAEIEPVHAGKTLRVSFFDAGDADGDANLEVQTPTGALPADCSWSIRGTATSGSSCHIVTTTSSTPYLYNGQWIDVEVRIPDTYTCDATTSTGCWWTVEYDFSGTSSAHDRTTWQIEVIGNPVRLIVDAP